MKTDQRPKRLIRNIDCKAGWTDNKDARNANKWNRKNTWAYVSDSAAAVCRIQWQARCAVAYVNVKRLCQ